MQSEPLDAQGVGKSMAIIPATIRIPVSNATSAELSG